MLRKSNIHWVVLISLMIVSGCQDQMIPAAYLPKTSEVRSDAYGKWIKVSSYTDSLTNLPVELSGELIAIESDTIFVLTEVDLITIERNHISAGAIYLFKSRKEPKFGLIGLIPTMIGIVSTGDYAGAFFMLGMPLILTSFLQAVIKGNGILNYPDKATMDDLVKFARYPQGMPPDIIRDSLHLKILVENESY